MISHILRLAIFRVLCFASIQISSNYRNITLMSSFLSDLSPIITKHCVHNIVPLDFTELQQEVLLHSFNYGGIQRETLYDLPNDGRPYLTCCNYFYFEPNFFQLMLIISKLQKKNQCITSRIFFLYQYQNKSMINSALKSTNKQYLNIFILSQDRADQFSIYGVSGFASAEIKVLGRWFSNEGWAKSPVLFWDKTRNFHGYTLTIVGLPYIPCTNIQENTINETDGNITASYYGVDISILNIIRAQRNFRYHIIQPPDGQWGMLLENKSWTGIMGYLQNRQADVGIGCTALTSDRASYVDYAQPHVEDFVQFVTSVPLDLPKWQSLIFPFNIIIWPLIFLTFALVFSVSHLLFRFSGLRELNEPVEIMSWITIVKIFWSQGLPGNRLHTHGLPIFFISWAIFSFLITQAYICNLVSYFTANPKENPIDTISELAHSHLKIAFHYYGSVGSVFFKHSNNPLMQEIGKRVILWKEDPLKCLQLVVKGEYALFDFNTYLSVVVPQYFLDGSGDPLVIFSKDKFSTPFSFMFPYQSPLQPLFNHYIERLIETGHVLHWKNQIYNAYKNVKVSKKSNPLQPLSLSHVYGLFLFGIFGLCAAIVGFVFEYLHFGTVKRIQARKRLKYNVAVIRAAERFKALGRNAKNRRIMSTGHK